MEWSLLRRRLIQDDSAGPLREERHPPCAELVVGAIQRPGFQLHRRRLDDRVMHAQAAGDDAPGPATLHVVSPAEVGLKAIGHVGAFRRAAAETIWPRIERALG